MVEDIEKWLIEILKENYGLSNISSNDNYFDAGLDSFSFITLVNTIEEKYQISFTNNEFQDRKFSTIHGLAEIIERRKNV